MKIISSSVNGIVSKELSDTNGRINYWMSEKKTTWLGKIIDNKIYSYNGSRQQWIWISNLQENIRDGSL